MNIQDIKDLMDKMGQTGISFLEIESEGTRLRLKRASWSKAEQAAGAEQAAVPEHLRTVVSDTAGAAMDESPGLIVTAPTVGIFYSSASPDSDPFVSIGSAVETGAPLCIIEAMKLMNEVTCPCDGIVLEIFAENGQRVEFGQPLMRIGGN
jgi:acetyl-CoA carboxylase biotin carboxyl carrier protein